MNAEEHMSFILVNQITKRYGSGDSAVNALDSVSFTIQSGEFVSQRSHPHMALLQLTALKNQWQVSASGAGELVLPLPFCWSDSCSL